MAVVTQRARINQYRFIWHKDDMHLPGVAVKASYVFLQLVDLALTIFGASIGFSELNAIMKGMLSAPLELLVFKLVIPVLIAWIVPWKFLLPAIALLLMVVGWNVKELLLLSF